jgi:Fe-S cluster assembly scaffold protein SufB
VTNPAALRLEQPLDIDDARRAARRLSELRREAEDTYDRLIEEAAEAERAYRKELSKAFLGLEGTAAQKEAEARAKVADKSFDRDLKASLVKAQNERLRGLEGERSMLKSLIEWSMRMRLDERQVA